MRIFARIFLSFWLATVLAISGSIAFVMFHKSEMNSAVARSIPLEKLQECAHETFELSRLGNDVQTALATEGCRVDYAVDESGHYLFSREAPRDLLPLIEQARQTGNIQVAPFPAVTTIVIPERIIGGASIVCVFQMKGAAPDTIRALVIEVIPFVAVTALICYLLAGYMVGPLKRLQGAAARIGGGDLSARIDGALNDRRDEFGQLARSFNQMAARIESLVTSQRMFLAHISHELGSPLTRLNLTLALARRKANAELKPELDRIDRESMELNDLVQQLLLLARLQSGTELSSDLTEFAVADVIREVVENAQFQAEQIDRSVRITRGEDFSVIGQRDLLKRAVDNVMRNALRFAPTGSVIRVEFYCEPGEKDGHIAVLDSGPGVPPDRAGSIFEPFSTSGPSGSHSGIGLGLTIARHAVRVHKGTIEAQNLPQGGLQISITLPVSAS